MMHLRPKIIHSLLAAIVAAGIVVMLCYFSYSLASFFVLQANEMTEKKNKLAALEKRYTNANDTISLLFAQLGKVKLASDGSEDLFKDDLFLIEEKFAEYGIELVSNDDVYQAPFAYMKITGRGKASMLFEAYFHIHGLRSQISEFSLKSLTPETPQGAAELSITLIQYYKPVSELDV